MEGVIEQFGIKWSLVAAETVNFFIVLGILYFFVFKKVSTFLDERSKKIEDGVLNAEKAEEVLQNAETEKESIISAAEKEAEQTVAESVSKGKERESQIVADAQAKSESIVADAKEKGQQEKDSIIASSKDEIAKLITLGAEQVLKNK